MPDDIRLRRAAQTGFAAVAAHVRRLNAEAAEALAGLPNDGNADEERAAILRKLEMINRVAAQYVPGDETRN